MWTEVSSSVPHFIQLLHNPHYIWMSSQGVISGKMASNDRRLSPMNG